MKLFMRHKYTTPESGATMVAGGSNIVGSNVVILDEISPNEMVTLEQIKEYLTTKGCVLWQQWDITSDEGREAAADWFMNEIDSLFRFMDGDDGR